MLGLAADNMRQPLRHNDTPVLRNPVVLGGLAAIGIALVVVVAVVALSAGDSDGDKSASIAPGATKRAAVTPTHATDISGLSGTATATINVRSGPGNDYSATGVLRKGADVSIVGKSDDGGWVEIQYPAHSNLHGWVMASSLEVHGDLAAAPIATPETLPMADVPTYEAVATEPPLLTPDVTVTPTSTPAAALARPRDQRLARIGRSPCRDGDEPGRRRPAGHSHRSGRLRQRRRQEAPLDHPRRAGL